MSEHLSMPVQVYCPPQKMAKKQSLSWSRSTLTKCATVKPEALLIQLQRWYHRAERDPFQLRPQLRPGTEGNLWVIRNTYHLCDVFTPRRKLTKGVRVSCRNSKPHLSQELMTLTINI